MADNPFVQRQNSSSATTASRYGKDPRELPIHVMAEANMYIKISAGSEYNCTAANAPTFFGNLVYRGAQASVSVADTYVTCANLSGRGRLYYVIPPSYAGGAFTPTARITIDGTVYTIAPSSTIPASNRMIIGATTPGIPSINTGVVTTSDWGLPNSYLDAGYQAALVGGFYNTSSSVGIVAPEVMEAYNMPFLQFETSCLVEFKTSLLAAAAGDKIGGAVYRMLPT